MVELVDENEGYGSEDENENSNGQNEEKVVNFLEDEDIVPFSLKPASGPLKTGQNSKTQTKPDKQKKPNRQPNTNETKPDGFWMGAITKSKIEPSSTELEDSSNKYGGKKSGKAKRYTMEEEDEFGQDQQEARGAAHGSTTGVRNSAP